MTPSQLPPPNRQLYSAEHDGMSLRVEVLDGAVNTSEVPDIRTTPWSWALEWLQAQGYRVRRVA